MTIIVLSIGIVVAIVIIIAMIYLIDRLSGLVHRMADSIITVLATLDHHHDPELQGSWNDLRDALDAVDDSWHNVNGLSITEVIMSIKAQRESIFGAREIAGDGCICNSADDHHTVECYTGQYLPLKPIDGYIRLVELERYLKDAAEGSDAIIAKGSLSLATRTKAAGRGDAFRAIIQDLTEGNIQ